MGVISSGKGIVNSFGIISKGEEKLATAKTENDIEKAKAKIASGKTQVYNSTATTIAAAASFAYNTYTAFSRFGQRGQDIQDRNALQDKIVNTGINLGLAFAINPALGAYQLLTTGISEVITTIKSNAQYDYNKMIDAEQKSITQERVGRANWNSSRR